jgi:hypothetical protein
MSDDDEDDGLEEDEDDFDDEDGGDDTQAVLVAGRSFSSGDMTRFSFDAFSTHVEEVARKHGVTLSIVGAGDLTETGPGPEDSIYATVIVGDVVDEGGSFGPDKISRDRALSILAGVEKIAAAVWSEIGAGLAATEKERFEGARTALHLTCTGPLAAGTLAFGVVGDRKGSGPGKVHWGQDSHQEPHEEGVWGEQVGYCQYEGPDAVVVDLGDEAHRARASSVGEGADYYLIARYD